MDELEHNIVVDDRARDELDCGWRGCWRGRAAARLLADPGAHERELRRGKRIVTLGHLRRLCSRQVLVEQRVRGVEALDVLGVLEELVDEFDALETRLGLLDLAAMAIDALVGEERADLRRDGVGVLRSGLRPNQSSGGEREQRDRRENSCQHGFTEIWQASPRV